ncbi:MAG: hypothetical protein ACFE7R_06385 [Candidatus Hodarchaeota archaeon]
MMERLGPDEYERSIEIGIIRAFGWAIIEFEEALFQKYLHMSGPSSVMTEDEFRRYLREMHSKAYISPLEFQGKRVWKKEVIEADLEEKLLRKEPILSDDVEPAERKRLHIPRSSPRDRLVSESKLVAEDILQIIETHLLRDGTFDSRSAGEIQYHIGELRKALASSTSDFLKYLRRHIPKARQPIEEILDSKGESIVLLSLRLLESR